MRKMLVALVAALSIPAAASASPMAAPETLGAAASPWYVTTKIGVFMPQADDLDGFNNGLSTEVQVGRRINANFAAELGLGWFSTSTDSVLGSKTTLSVVPLTATAKGILPFGDAELYGLGGVGTYRGAVDVETPEGDFTDSEWNFGLHLGAGAEYALTKQLSVGVEGRYLIAETFDANMNGFLLNGGLAFHF